MRSRHLFAICFFSLQCLVLVQAQRPKSPEDPNPEPENPIPRPPAPPDDPSAPKANVPGALAVGHEQYPAPSTEKTDVGEIGKQLSELIDKIVSAFDFQTSTTTSTDRSGQSTTITATITNDHAFPTPALGCADAENYYYICSSSFANFTALPRTQQVGCLCNVYNDSDFNGVMNSCYSYLAPNNHPQTQYAVYATAVSSGTALCASTPSTPGTTAVPVPPPPTPSPTKSPNGAAASRVYGTAYYPVMLALGLMLLSCPLF